MATFPTYHELLNSQLNSENSTTYHELLQAQTYSDDISGFFGPNISTNEVNDAAPGVHTLDPHPA